MDDDVEIIGQIPQDLIRTIKFYGHDMLVVMVDGREVTIDWTQFKRLRNATDKQRENWSILGRGEGVHWEELDEDLSARGILRDGVSYNEQENIVQNIAQLSPRIMVNGRPSEECFYCMAEVDDTDELLHKNDCLWLRAVLSTTKNCKL